MSDPTKPIFECVVSADLFKRALAGVSTEETRYYLQGVNVEPCVEGGALLVSTDGHRLLVLRDVAGFVRNGSGIVSLNKDLIKALTAKPWSLPNWASLPSTKTPRTRYLAVRGGRAAVIEFHTGDGGEVDFEAILSQVDAPSIVVGAYQWARTTIDGTFPDWRRVIGEPGEGGVLSCVNINQLQPIVKALTGQGEDVAFRLAPTKGDAAGPVYVVPYRPTQGFAVIMPLRPVANPDELPSAPDVPTWLAKSAPPNAEAA